MTNRTTRPACGAALLLVIFLSLSETARAQDAPPPAPSPPPPPAGAGTEPDEGDASLNADLDAALAADASVSTDPQPARGGATSTNLLNPDISALFLMAGAAYSHDDHVLRGGHAPRENGFNWQELELGIQSVVDPYFRFDAFISFPAPDEIEIEEMYATTLDLPWGLEAKVGQFLAPFGRLNQTHLHRWSFADPPLPMSRFLGDGEGLRAIGGQLDVLLPLPFFVKVTYDVHRPPTPEEDDEPAPGSVWQDILHVARVEAFFPLGDEWSLYLGASGAEGPNTFGPSHHTELVGGDVYLRYKPVTGASFFELGWTTEGMWRRRGVPGPNLYDEGMYSQLDVRFAQRWRAAGRFDLVRGQLFPAVDAAPRNDDTDHPEWRASASLSFQPTEFSQLRLQYGFDHPDWLSHPVHEAFLQVAFNIGPHGAHAF